MSLRITSDSQATHVRPQPPLAPPVARESAERAPAASGAAAPDTATARLALRNALEGLDRARLAEGLLASGRPDASEEVARLAGEDPALSRAAALAGAGETDAAREAVATALSGAAGHAESAALAAANVSAAVERIEDADRAGAAVAGVRATLLESGALALAVQANQSSDRVAGLLG
jgi:hypothetical protein